MTVVADDSITRVAQHLAALGHEVQPAQLPLLWALQEQGGAMTIGALGERLDRFDQGVACVDVDTGVAVGQGGFRLVRHEKCRGVCNNCWDFGGTPCILR